MSALETNINPSRREFALVALATFAGAVLRLWELPRLGLDHFDEGIYALAGLWITSPRGLAALDPGLIPYAPPVYPILVGLSYLVFGISDTAAILVSIVAGIATITVVAWLARRTFGPGSGAAAAWLCALSGPHVAFSRTALTDSTALLTFLIAIGLGMRFLERPGFVRALLLGLAVGLAQNTKYNGLLAGVVVAAAWGVGILKASVGRQSQVDRARLEAQTADSGRSPIKALALGLLAALVAAGCYWPWYRFVEAQPGGYADLMRHHRGYVMGLGAWLGNLRQQLAQSHAFAHEFANVISWAGPAALVAVLASAWACRSLTLRCMILALSMMILLGLLPTLGWWAALPLSATGLISGSIARRVLAGSWWMFSILVPLYHPYARLWLPLESLGWILLGGMIPSAIVWVSSQPLDWRMRLGQCRMQAGLGIAAFALASTLTFIVAPRPVLWPFAFEGRGGLRDAADRIASPPGKARRMGLTPTQGRHLVLWGRPALVFYLGLKGVGSLSRVDSEEQFVLENHPPNTVWILDELMLTLPDEAARWKLPSRDPADGIAEVGGAYLSLPTLLDADPGAAYGRSQLVGRSLREAWGPHPEGPTRPWIMIVMPNVPRKRAFWSSDRALKPHL